jgi:hypothetical protein
VIIEGWYVPKKPSTENGTRMFSRWVLGIRDGRICYSKGGVDHYFCLYKTFFDWVKRTEAELQRK